MNEQIKKLKKQATVERQGHGAFGEPEFYEELDIDKFAELLEKEFEAKYFSEGYIAGKSDGIIETVRECMTICEDVTERNDPTIACYYAIKEHFGVES